MDTNIPPTGNGEQHNGGQQNGGQHSIVPTPGQSQTGGGPQLSDAERQDRLFEWAFEVLERLGFVAAIANAATVEDLNRVVFDADATEVMLAIRAALHPADGTPPARHFHGLKPPMLAKILRNRFNDLKKDRAKELLTGGSQPEPDWTEDLIFRRDGKIEPNLANLTLMLRHSPAWQGVIAYSEFDGYIIIRRQPPWGPEKPDASWTEDHITSLSIWFLRNGMASPAKEKVIAAVQKVGKENPFHPVRDYFEALKWDGVSRLGHWLQTYLKVKDSPYVQAIGPRVLISSVARIYEPREVTGTKADHVLVLEGPQGRNKKSQTVETLVPKPEWFTDQISDVRNKDAKMEVVGVMIIEVPEMEALIQAKPSAMKKFISLKRDRFRPPFGRRLIDWPRQCIFIGTYNPIPGEGWLKDPTGTRRFWPVATQGEDVERLRQDRDLLWAEAVARFKAGEKWWLETPELEALATAEQEARFARDEWELPMRALIGTQTEVTVGAILKGLRFSNSHSNEIRVAKILKHRFGFKQVRARKNDDRYVCYRRDTAVDLSEG